MNRFFWALRRAVLGHSDDDATRARLLADEGPHSPTMPPFLTVADPDARLSGSWAVPPEVIRPPCPHGRTARCGRCQAEAEGVITAAKIQGDRERDQFLTAVDHATEQVRRAGLPDPAGDAVPDITDTNPAALTNTGETDEDTTRNLVSDSGVHAIPEADERTAPIIRAVCPTCKGRGYMERTINDLLRESAALIPPDGGDMVIKEFYTRLLHLAPGLTRLFPPDLLTAATQDGASPGAMQRDRLLRYIVELAESYGAGREAMTRLRTALEAAGRRHAAFARPDGTVQPATPDEYIAVRDVFLGTFADVAGDQWQPAYAAAWARAYHYAMSVMLNAQEEYIEEHGEPAARYPRRDASHG